MRATVLFLASATLAGCAVGPDFQQPDIELASRYVDARAVDTRSVDADWWKGFHDPLLVALVDKAISGNTDLAQARARIDQSRAAALGADAKLLPAAETADAYLALRSFQSRLAIAENQEQTERGLVDVVQQRFNEGLAPEREL